MTQSVLQTSVAQAHFVTRILPQILGEDVKSENLELVPLPVLETAIVLRLPVASECSAIHLPRNALKKPMTSAPEPVKPIRIVLEASVVLLPGVSKRHPMQPLDVVLIYVAPMCVRQIAAAATIVL